MDYADFLLRKERNRAIATEYFNTCPDFYQYMILKIVEEGCKSEEVAEFGYNQSILYFIELGVCYIDDENCLHIKIDHDILPTLPFYLRMTLKMLYDKIDREVTKEYILNLIINDAEVNNVISSRIRTITYM